MGFGQTLLASFGIDTSGYVAGLKDSVRQTNTASGEIESGLGRAAHGTDRIFTSSHRAARQFSQLTRDMANGVSGADLLASGLDRLERSLHLPLGALAGLGVLAVVAEKMSQANEEAIKLNDEIAKIGKTSSSAQFSTLDALEAKMEKLHKQAEELEKLSKFGFGFVTRSLTGSQEQVEIDKKIVAEQELATQRGIGNKISQEAYVQELRNSGDVAGAKRQELAIEQEIEASKYRNGNADLVTIEAVERKQKAERESLEIAIAATEEAEKAAAAKKDEAAAAKEAAEAKKQEAAAMKQRERLQFSLEELAGRDSKISNSQSIQAWWAGEQARQVQRDQALAREQAVGAPGSEIAKATQDRSDRQRAGISELKESERGAGGLAALVTQSNEHLASIDVGINSE